MTRTLKGAEVAVFTAVLPLLSHMLTVASISRCTGRRPKLSATMVCSSAADIVPLASML